MSQERYSKTATEIARPVSLNQTSDKTVEPRIHNQLELIDKELNNLVDSISSLNGRLQCVCQPQSPCDVEPKPEEQHMPDVARKLHIYIMRIRAASSELNDIRNRLEV